MRRSDRRRRATDELYFFRTSTGVPVERLGPVDGLPARPLAGLFRHGVRVVRGAAAGHVFDVQRVARRF